MATVTLGVHSTGHLQLRLGIAFAVSVWAPLSLRKSTPAGPSVLHRSLFAILSDQITFSRKMQKPQLRTGWVSHGYAEDRALHLWFAVPIVAAEKSRAYFRGSK